MPPEPANFDFTLIRGDSWTQLFQFWNDKNKTVASDLTGCTVDIVFRDKQDTRLSSLTGGVLLGSSGIVQANFLGTDSAQFAKGEFEVPWYMRITRSDGHPQTLLRGNCYVEEP